MSQPQRKIHGVFLGVPTRFLTAEPPAASETPGPPHHPRRSEEESRGPAPRLQPLNAAPRPASRQPHSPTAAPRQPHGPTARLLPSDARNSKCGPQGLGTHGLGPGGQPFSLGGMNRRQEGKEQPRRKTPRHASAEFSRSTVLTPSTSLCVPPWFYNNHVLPLGSQESVTEIEAPEGPGEAGIPLKNHPSNNTLGRARWSLARC